MIENEKIHIFSASNETIVKIMDRNNIFDIDQSDFEKIEESEQKSVIVDFWAPWCGLASKILTLIMEKVAKEYADDFNLIKINIDENNEIASQLRIQSIPTVYALRTKIINAFQGVISEKISSILLKNQVEN